MQIKSNKSEEKLNKFLNKVDLGEAKYDFLKSLVKAATDLYGIIYFKDLLEIARYISSSGDYPLITIEDLNAFTKVLSKTSEDILALDIDLLFPDETKEDDSKVLINSRLINLGYNTYETVISVMNAQADKPYFVPKDLLTFENSEKIDCLREARRYLANLVVTESSYTTRWNTVIPCLHVGKKLSEFDYLTENEKLKKNLLAGKIKDGPKEDKKKLARYIEYKKGPESEKLIRDFLFNCSCGVDYPMNAIRTMLEEIAQTGVLVDEDKTAEITGLMVNLYNSSNLYINRGYRPKDLKMELCETDEDVSSPYGPGMQKALMEGVIDADRLIEAMKDRGWNI